MCRVRRPYTPAVLLAVATPLLLGGCEVNTVSTTDCVRGLQEARCTVKVTGTDFHEMSDTYSSDRNARFRLVSAVAGGEAHLQYGRVDGGIRCRAGEVVELGSETLTCLEVGDNALTFKVQRPV